MMDAVKKVLRGTLKDLSLGFCLPLAYGIAARRRIVSGKVIFAAMKESAMPDAFKALYERLEEEPLLKVSYVSLKQNESSLIQYFFNSLSFLRDMATAQYVFLEDASDVVSCVRLRPETKVIQLWHACGAFKKWGMSTANLKFGGTKEDLLRHPFYRNLSLVTVSSPEVIWAYAEAMVLEDQIDIIKPTGISRTDRLFDPAFLNSARARIERVVPAAKNKKILLYAPTFRGRVLGAEGPDGLDLSMMKESLSEEYILVIKHHPFVKHRPSIPKDCCDFAFDVSGDLPIDELLCCADMCISDYSSLVFEYSLFERPMLFFAFDVDDYGDWRGFYYDYDDLTPGPVCRSTEELISHIREFAKGFDKSEVTAFRHKFMGACDGHSTERIVKEVFGDTLNCNDASNLTEVGEGV